MGSCSNFTKSSIEILLQMTTLCLENNFVKFRNKYFKQKTGIITGDNNSVSLANIALHYIIKNIPEIKRSTVIFKRFIDDIIYIAKDNGTSQNINNRLIEEFRKYGLELTFREMATKEINTQVEFLDVLHCSRKGKEKNFIITDFIKPTATNATFINGKSFHPVHIFKGIIFGEAKRLRRLNETEEGYEKSLERLKEKCKKSEFKEWIIEETFEIVKDYTNIWNIDWNKLDIKKLNDSKKSIWATKLKGIINLTNKEKSLVPGAQIVYSRPPALSSIITNYRRLSKIDEMKDRENGNVGCKKCGKCGLCGNHGKLQNMVRECSNIRRKNGTEIEIKQRLECKDHGIYAAICKVCEEIYVGQTTQKFSERWNGHRGKWNKMIEEHGEGYKSGLNKEEDDKQALFLHYAKKHDRVMWREGKTLKLAEAYEVVFLEKGLKNKLDTAENFWISQLKSEININKTFLPKFK